MKTPTHINDLRFITSCCNTTLHEHEEFMKNTTKANGKLIEKHIRKFLPEMSKEFSNFKYYNPFIGQCVKKPGVLIYIHSCIEYFFEYN